MKTSHLLAIFAMIAAATFTGCYHVSQVENRLIAHFDADVDTIEEQISAEIVDQQQIISEYLKKRGAIYHEEVARACVEAGKDPYLLAAIATVEGANPYARGAAGEYGSWQVRAKYWGKVPADTYGQARQAELILDVLLMRNNGNLGLALYDYNGKGDAAARYAKAVVAHYYALRNG